ncbi:MAG: hypothetical protein ABW328_15850 [Ilumatobacteraceae bacterium]
MRNALDVGTSAAAGAQGAHRSVELVDVLGVPGFAETWDKQRRQRGGHPRPWITRDKELWRDGGVEIAALGVGQLRLVDPRLMGRQVPRQPAS